MRRRHHRHRQMRPLKKTNDDDGDGGDGQQLLLVCDVYGTCGLQISRELFPLYRPKMTFRALRVQLRVRRLVCWHSGIGRCRHPRKQKLCYELQC